MRSIQYALPWGPGNFGQLIGQLATLLIGGQRRLMLSRPPRLEPPEEGSDLTILRLQLNNPFPELHGSSKVAAAEKIASCSLQQVGLVAALFEEGQMEFICQASSFFNMASCPCARRETPRLSFRPG